MVSIIGSFTELFKFVEFLHGNGSVHIQTILLFTLINIELQLHYFPRKDI